MKYPLIYDRSIGIAKKTNNEKYPKKCWSVMLFLEMITISWDFSLLRKTFHTSPQIPKAIRISKVAKLIELRMLNERLLFAISTTSLIKISQYIGTKAEIYKRRFFKNCIFYFV